MNRNTPLAEIRQHLHRFPELSGQEVNTHKLLHGLLTELKPDQLTTVAGTGLLATWKSAEPGSCTLVRGDMDALPITEAEDKAVRSETTGVAHLCGHDGHTTMLYGVARQMALNPPVRGTVHLVFQPAEETGQGAKDYLADPVMADIRPDRSWALHNIPGRQTGEVIWKHKTFSSSVISWVLHFNGSTAHAAEPQNARTPARVIEALLRRAHELTDQNHNGTVVTPIHINMGQLAYGTTPGNGEIHFTLRAYDDATRDSAIADLQEVLKTSATLGRGVTYRENTLEEFPATENDPGLVEELKKVISDGGYSNAEKPEPYGWGEDFGHFGKLGPSLMFGLGSGTDNAPLHDPLFSFPDELIDTGVDLFKRLIQKHHV